MKDRKQKYYEVITDAWQLMKDHLDHADFDKMYLQVRDLDRKYKDTEYFDFASAVIVGVMSEINRLHGEEG